MRVLVRKVNESTAELDSQGVGNALFGLQGMSSDVPEVRQLVGVLVRKVDELTAELDAQGVGNALYGLQGIDISEQWVQPIRQWLQRLDSMCEEVETVEPEYVATQVLGFSCSLQSLLIVSHCDVVLSRQLKTMGFEPELEGLIQKITNRLQLLREQFPSLAPVRASRTEQQFAKLVARALGTQSTPQLTTNEWLFGFEADLVLRLPAEQAASTGSDSSAQSKSSGASDNLEEALAASHEGGDASSLQDCVIEMMDSVANDGAKGECSADNSEGGATPCRIVNIEVDGPHHKQSRSRRFCSLRDLYLSRVHAVQVLRLDVVALAGLSQAQQVDHIRERLRQLGVPTGSAGAGGDVTGAASGPH